MINIAKEWGEYIVSTKDTLRMHRVDRAQCMIWTNVVGLETTWNSLIVGKEVYQIEVFEINEEDMEYDFNEPKIWMQESSSNYEDEDDRGYRRMVGRSC